MQLRLVTVLFILTVSPAVRAESACLNLKKIFTDRFYSSLDSQSFDEEKARISELIKRHEFDPNSITNASLETKLAALEAMSPSIVNPGETIPEIYKTLSPYKRLRLKHAVQRLHKSTFTTKAKLDLRIEKIYVDLLHERYPKLSEGLSDRATQKLLHDIVQARLASKEVGVILKEMGLLDENPTEFQKVFDRILKGNEFRYAWSARGNAISTFRLVKGHYIIGLPVPPKLFMQRWVKIPAEMLDRAAREGLAHVWEDGMRDYLMQNYKGLMKKDLIYNQIQNAWDYAIDAVFTVYYFEKFKAWHQQNLSRKNSVNPE